MKKWNIVQNSKFKIQNSKFDGIIHLLLSNRGIKTKKEVEEFLHPKLEDVTIEKVGIDKKEVKKTLKRLKIAYEKKEQIVIFGDYDVDGITGTAILWETLYGLGFNVLPYIPHRVDEGYGLSKTGITNVQLQITNVRLIITVDNGIVAGEAIDYANKLGIDVIITDHHVAENASKQPGAYAIVHTTKLCGAGVALLLSKEVRRFVIPAKAGIQKKGWIPDQVRNDNEDSHLELATLGTIADLVPLLGANRTIVKYGLQKLRQTKRLGLLAIFQEAGIDPLTIGTYEVGFMIAPRLNAAGRIESAMDSLRLLCTKNVQKASDLAANLGRINRHRQEIMKEATQHAVTKIKNQKSKIKKIIFIGDESYNPGVIGLVAGKLVEQFYRPAIVLSIGETHAKASVRSVKDINIIEFLRMHNDFFVNIGGHPMAAGFTVEISKMQELQKKLEESAEEYISTDLLVRSLRIDCELPLWAITPELFAAIQKFSPFGMGNPEPIFMTRRVKILDMKTLGQEGKHLKLRINDDEEKTFEAIGFGMGELSGNLSLGDQIDIAYTIDENKWNGNVSLQLKLKDVKYNFSS